MTAAIFGLLGVIVGGLLNAGVSRYFERARELRESQAVARLLLVEVGDAFAKLTITLKVGNWGRIDPIAWTMWASERRELAHTVVENEAWLPLANLAMSVHSFNDWLAETQAGTPLTALQKRRIGEGVDESSALMTQLLPMARGEHGRKPKRRTSG